MKTLLPQPQSFQGHPDEFLLLAQTSLAATGEAASVAEFLAATLRRATGFELPIGEAGEIVLTLSPSLESLGGEGYRLEVTPQGVHIAAAERAGLFHGVQSLLQLLPSAIYASHVQEIDWRVPCVKIEDAPRFGWRGLMLDCGRRFFPLDDLKRLLDLMALHKLNVFHWHLVEDAGWRLEIKKYPRLTEVGAWRRESPLPRQPTQGDGVPYGGFYTQDEARELVAYAAARHITIVPEIEMPGHTLSSLAAYPQFSCTGGPFEPIVRWGLQSDIYCAGNDATFGFIEAVLEEVLAIFPSQFIHVGGDEAPKDQWEKCPKCQQRIQDENLKDEGELQSYFLRRIEKYLDGKGRRLIGWDEILEGGLAPHATVMSWRGEEGGIAAASLGHDVVMTPQQFCYFDAYQSLLTDGEPEGFQLLPLEKTWGYEPIPAALPVEKQHHVLGVQGCMWGEYAFDWDKVEFQVFPRLCALAEAGWSPPQPPDWPEFKERLGAHLGRLDALHVNYRKLEGGAARVLPE